MATIDLTPQDDAFYVTLEPAWPRRRIVTVKLANDRRRAVLRLTCRELEVLQLALNDFFGGD